MFDFLCEKWLNYFASTIFELTELYLQGNVIEDGGPNM